MTIGLQWTMLPIGSSDQFGFCVHGCAFKVLTNPKLSESGFELDDGGIIEYPDSEGTIRRLDQFGNCGRSARADRRVLSEWKAVVRVRWTMKSLKQAIWDNRRFHKYERLLRRIRLRIFDYEDQGNLDKAQRIIERIKAICGPMVGEESKTVGKQDARTADSVAP